MTVTQKHLKDVLDYDSGTGIFTWRHRADATTRWNAQYAEKQAGRLSTHGYVQIKIDGTLYYAHRLAWLWLTGVFPASQIDHADGQKANNAAQNLREASAQLNAANTRPKRHNKSGFKGVCYIARIKAWQASVKVDGRSLHLGYHATPEEAHAAYVKAAEQHFGEYSRAA